MNLCDSIARRIDLKRKARNNAAFQALALAASRVDIPLWVNDWVWTYDPREKPANLPFDLFPRQEEFLLWLAAREEAQQDGLAEKCRDVGFTWLCAAYAVHGWLFRDGFKAGFGSRKLDLVDKLGDPDCIFEKIRFIIDNLPRWMLPQDYDTGWCKIVNHQNGSTITGEGGDQIGRGGRSSIYFVDEAAFLEHSDKVDGALSMTSNCKVWVSTPNGPGNAFYKKRHSGKYEVFTFRWKDDPRKGPEWYQKQKELLDPVTLAQEVDIDYTASIEGICIPAKWVRAAVELEKRMDLPGGPLVAALDIADGGGNRTVYGERCGPVVQSEIKEWSDEGTFETAHTVRDMCISRKVTALNYDAGGGYDGTLSAICSPDNVRDSNGKPRFIAQGLNGGESASSDYWPDGRTSAEKFANARAEWWWKLRRRFEKTFEHVNGKASYPADELISIPNHEMLISQLSTPLAEVTETGKTRIESKVKMRARGVSSPDFADMLAYLFVPVGSGELVVSAEAWSALTD